MEKEKKNKKEWRKIDLIPINRLILVNVWLEMYKIVYLSPPFLRRDYLLINFVSWHYLNIYLCPYLFVS